MLFGLTGHTAEVKIERDYTQAKALFDSIQRSGRPVEPAINEFARAGKFEEIVVALSTLCRLPIDSVERIMSDKRVGRRSGAHSGQGRPVCHGRPPS